MKEACGQIDAAGEKTLRSIAIADRFNAWMYEQVRPYAQGKILEIGSGIGNLSEFFVKDRCDLTLSDVRTQYTEQLAEKFPGREVLEIDLVHPNFDVQYGHHLETYDLVFALNVLEHIKDDRLALENMRSLLKPGGIMFLLVPAYPWLFNHFDRVLGHHRRYTSRSLSRVHPDGLKVMQKRYFNMMGIPGWYIVGGLLRKRMISVSDMRLYNSLIQFFRLMDRLVCKRVGLSVIQVSKKISCN